MVTITNPGDSALKELAIRLDQNLFAPNTARSSPSEAMPGASP
jgi:hypothetical protein